MRNVNCVIFGAVIVVIGATAAFFAFGVFSHNSPVKSLYAAHRANNVYEAMQEMSVEELVSDEAARVFYRNLFSGVRNIDIALKMTQEAIFTEHFCTPLFPEAAQNNEAYCRELMNGTDLSVYSGVRRVAEVAAGLIATRLEHQFDNPRNLMSFYFKKRDVFVDEYNRQSLARQTETIRQIDETVAIAMNLIVNGQNEAIAEQYRQYSVLKLQSNLSVHSDYTNLGWKYSEAFYDLGGLIAETFDDPAFEDVFYASLYDFLTQKHITGGDEYLQQFFVISIDFQDHVR